VGVPGGFGEKQIVHCKPGQGHGVEETEMVHDRMPNLLTTLTLLDFACTAVMLGLSSLALGLAARAHRSRASQYLMAYFACVAVDSTVSLAGVGWPASIPQTATRWLHVANVPLGYLYGVLLYGYVVALTSPQQGAFSRRQLWHVLPYAVVLVFSLINAFWALDVTPAGLRAFKLSYHAWVLSGLLYLLAAVLRIYRSRPVLEQCNASESALRLSWLRGLTLLLAVSWIWMTVDRLGKTVGYSQPPALELCLDGLTVMTLYVLAWFGLHQPVLMPEDAAKETRLEATGTATAYARSGLDARQCTAMAAELAHLVTHERLYTDSQLDLQALSQRSGWPPNYISQALNQGLGLNFFEFVNGFRVKAAQRCLADPTDQRTILEVALACGFGSKSTFNAVFKRLTGQTPRESRRTGSAASDPLPT
jgi:AraC-like DNA-binding protein